MNVQIDKDFRITSQPLNLILEEKYLTKPKEGLSKVSWKNVGYYSSLRALLKSYARRKFERSEVTDIEEVISKLDEINDNISSVKNIVGE